MSHFKPLLEQEMDYIGEVTINGISCAVGYSKKFKWSWMATQLNTFVFMAQTEDTIAKNTIEKFSSSCLEYAIKNNKGWPRGLQSAVGSIAILQSKNVDRSASDFCERFSKKHFSAFEIPIVFDSTKSIAYRYHQKPLWGKIYYPFFTKLISTITSKL
ncbi:hypothetical protein [Flavobacterium kingsejongi]|nr:hypothetical protein [Flavobacterium kingsejongi]